MGGLNDRYSAPRIRDDFRIGLNALVCTPMAAAKRKAAPLRVLTEDELIQVARELVKRAPGLSGSDVKKELGPDLKHEEKRVLRAATTLAARHEIFRWSSARKVRFFLEDPLDGLAHVVKQSVAAGPMREADLRYRLERIHRGYGDLLKPWLKGALARGDLYTHRALRGTRDKRYGAVPDWGEVLKKAVAELKKVFSMPAGLRHSPSEVLLALASELEQTATTSTEPRDDARSRFLSQLMQASMGNSSGLISVRDLRSKLSMEKSEFDQLALELARDGLVTLHQHDFPSSLSEHEQAALIVDSRGNHFIGIAARRP